MLSQARQGREILDKNLIHYNTREEREDERE